MRREGHSLARHLLAATLTTAATMLSGPALAGAEVRAGTLSFERPEDRPSLTPQPPETQRHRYTQSIEVSYDDQSGAVSIKYRIYDASFWTDDLPMVYIGLGTTCSEDLDEVVARFTYYHLPGDEWDPPYTAAGAYLSRAGYEGELAGTITPTGDGFMVTFPGSPALAGLDLRCFGEGVGAGGPRAYFVGHEPFELKRSTTTAWFKRALAARYGREYTEATVRWALCPREQYFPNGLGDESGPSAFCMAQFKHRGRWRYVSALIEQGDPDPFMHKPYTRTWKRAWRRTPARCARQARVKGAIYSNDGTCPSLMVGDIAYSVSKGRTPRYVWWHGTNTAGFTKVVRFRCASRGKTVTCTNGLGDAFRWKRP